MTNGKGICKHCRHRKIKKLHGVIVSDYCNKYRNRRSFPECLRCNGFSRSLKSRLGLI